ncbi:Sulphatase-modifying factor domain protein, partial [Candidatus Magnetomorum sp. HK-1]
MQHHPPDYTPDPFTKGSGIFILTPDKKIAGKMMFSNTFSDFNFVINGNGEIHKTQKKTVNNHFNSIQIFDIIAKIEAQKLFHAIISSKSDTIQSYCNKHFPKNFNPNKDIEFQGKLNVEFNGIISGQIKISHIKSDTVFILNNNGTIEREIIKEKIDIVENMTFVWIPGGCYEMGCDQSSGYYECAKFEILKHIVCLNGFWMSKTEVTQGQWKKIMKTNPATFQTGDLNYPIESISFHDIHKYINNLNDLISKNNIGQVCLPTEAEWEYACTNCGTKIVREWLKANNHIQIKFLPAYSPNLNLIERFWKYAKKQLVKNTYYKKYKEFRANTFQFLNNVKKHYENLKSLMVEKFQIVVPKA